MRTQETVRSEEVRALFGQGVPILWSHLGVGVVVVAALWREQPHPRLLLWFGALAFMTAIRGLYQARYTREQPAGDELDAWGRRFVLGSSVAGMLWGTAAVLFFSPDQAPSQSLLTLAVGGMTTAAAGTLACHLPAFFAFSAFALVPLIARTMAEGDPAHLGIAAMLIACAAGLQWVARNNHKAFVRGFQLGVENTELLDRLSVSRLDLQETNRTLEERVVERTKELEQQGEVLQQAQRLEVAGRLAGGLAHDFNSLLTVVINNAALLLETQPLDEQGKLATNETMEAGRRGAALIRQLLALSRRRPAEPRVFSLNALLEEWEGLLGYILGEGISAVVTLSPDPLHVHADPAQVEQVLVNLVANARASMPSGGQLRITARARKLVDDAEVAAGDYAELSVEHTGTSDAQQTVIPSYGSDGRSRGSGLAVVWGMAAQWGGRISVDSEPSTGTCFRVLLPTALDATAPASARRQEAPKDRRGATVMVVDDEPTLRSVLRRCLTREGYKVLVAEAGERALELARAETGPIDLLITDVVMPGMTGLELARQLLLERPTASVLFISGFTFEESVPPTDLANGTAYLSKPFDTQVLTQKVRELLATSTRSNVQPLKASG